MHGLEKSVDAYRAAKVRRLWLSHRVPADIVSGIPYRSDDAQFYRFYHSVLGACAENVIGYVPLPVGVAGPILVNSERHYIPMATVEGTLVASTSRGCKAICESGGATCVVMKRGMTRAPVLQFPTAARAAEFREWLEREDVLPLLKSEFQATTNHGRLQSVKVTVAGTYAYPRFTCLTGDAMGMNMVSKGVDRILCWVGGTFADMRVLGLSGNMCCDKKPASVNWTEGRGYSVVCEAELEEEVVLRVLKTTPRAMQELNIAKNLVGSAMSGMSAGGYNAHSANIVSSVFLATGQDPAQVVVSANCITLMHVVNRDGKQVLHVSCTMPSIEVGTVGGGTHLEAQNACLKLLQHPCAMSGESLSQKVAAAVLAGEVSLNAAMTSASMVDAHMKLIRRGSAEDGASPRV